MGGLRPFFTLILASLFPTLPDPIKTLLISSTLNLEDLKTTTLSEFLDFCLPLIIDRIHYNEMGTKVDVATSIK